MRNYFGEIDIICRKGDFIIFVEVKSRTSINYTDYNLVTKKQIERIKRSAIYYMKQKGLINKFKMRFDLVLIRPYAFPKHLINYFV